MDALHAHAGPARRSFGPFVLDTERAELRRDGVPVALRPKTHALLAYLADHAGVVVPKQELLDAVWPGLVVTDDSLTQAISELRSALGDDGPALIRTLPRRGYRFDALVAPVPGAAPAPAAATPAVVGDRAPRWLVHGTAVVFGLVVVALMSVGLVQMRAAAPRIDAELAMRQSVAVLPFVDLSEPKAPHVASAVDADLITELGRLGDIRVVSTDSTAALVAAVGMDARRIGREFDVRHVLSGSLRREGDRLSITVQLLRTDTGALLWADRFDYPSLSDWSGRSDVAARVASLLETKVAKSVVEQAVRQPQRSEALDHWMRGSQLLRTFKSHAELLEARRHFAAALAAQPDSVRALSGLGATHVCEVLYHWSTDPKASLALGKALARQALDIDPYDQTALKMLTGAHLFAGDLDDAMSTARRQLELNPRDAHSNRDVAAILQSMGRWDEALRQVDIAQRLNPLDHSHVWKCHSIRARVLIVLRRYDEAISESRLAVAADSSIVGPYLHLATAEALRGNLGEAQRHVAEVLRRQPDMTIAKVQSSQGSTYPQYRAGIAHYYEGLRLAGLPEGGAR